MSSRNKTNVKKLFEFWCEVKQNTTIGATQQGIIVAGSEFPKNFKDKNDIPAFTFPCEFKSESVHSYSFVLTGSEAHWRFGICRYDPKTDSALVILSHLPWHDTFHRFLTVLARLRRENFSDFSKLLHETYEQTVPDPGGYVKLDFGEGENFIFEHPLHYQLPSIPENYNLTLYYSFANPENMIAVFAAMLAERRIIFTSRYFDRISSCVQAAHAFLYPMVWQHIFVPVLPMKHKDILSAPMPYLVGVPEIVLQMVTPEELGEVVIFNCDTKEFESRFDNRGDALPKEILEQLKRQLSQTHKHIGDRVSKIFLGVLVQLIGGYRDAVEFRGTGKVFNQDKFIESRPNHLQNFLKKIMDLQIFQQFIDERLQMLNTGLGLSDEFEMETVRYAENMKKHTILHNFKKKVKENSRGVKEYYKGLKTKLRDVTPTSNSTQFRSHVSSNIQHANNHIKLDGGAGHRSAPSSPLSSKRNVNDILHYSPESFNGSAHGRRYPAMLSTSSSGAYVFSNKRNGLGASPNDTPESSLNSDMNLSQELEHHPLFNPTVLESSSLRSMPATSSDNISGKGTQRQNSNISDLIELNDNNSADFDLEDLDPLNQNARPLPMLSRNKRISPLSQHQYRPNSSNPILFNESRNIQQNNKDKTTRTSVPQSINLLEPPPLPKSLPPTKDDENELLRKYGLDQFALTATTTTTSNSLNTVFNNKTTTVGRSDWTTFD